MSITLITGGMWSGKTSELFRRLGLARVAGQETRLYKYSGDTRYVGRANLASSHDQLHKEAVPVNSLKDCTIEPNMVIGIDEGQFIDGLVDFCERAANQNCTVIVSALNSDFNRNSFPRIAALYPKCEHVETLHAICFDCKGRASFTKRISLSETSSVEDIGGDDKYRAVCRNCF